MYHAMRHPNLTPRCGNAQLLGLPKSAGQLPLEDQTLLQDTFYNPFVITKFFLRGQSHKMMDFVEELLVTRHRVAKRRFVIDFCAESPRNAILVLFVEVGIRHDRRDLVLKAFDFL